MKRSLLCVQCGKILVPSSKKCPRCGADIDSSPLFEFGEPFSEEPPSFEKFIELPFEKLEAIMEKSYEERIDLMYTRLCSLEEEVEAFLRGIESRLE